MKILAGTCIFNKGKILLLQQNGDGPQPLLWGPPAGHGKDGEEASEVAIRETKEETNLDVEITGLVQVCLLNLNDGREYLAVFYSAKPKNINKMKIDPKEATSYCWASREEIKSDKYTMRQAILKSIILKSFESKSNIGDLIISYKVE
jgi:ADP-ribose pyrophosphatase YjhB (NUDIX family)